MTNSLQLADYYRMECAICGEPYSDESAEKIAEA